MSKILGTLVVQSWIDKRSLRRWPAIHKLIANVSEIDPVLFKNTIQNLGGDAGSSLNHLPLLNTMHDKLQDMRNFGSLQTTKNSSETLSSLPDLMGAVETEKNKGLKGEGSTVNTNVDLKAFQPKDMKTLNQSMQSMLKFKAAKESFIGDLKT